jgi:hypothetical protein
MPSLIETFDALASLDNALRTAATTARALTLAKPKTKPKPQPPRTQPYSRHELDTLIDRLEERTRGM